MKSIFTLCILLVLSTMLCSQGIRYSPDDPAHRIADKWNILYDFDANISSSSGYTRAVVSTMVEELIDDGLAPNDKGEAKYIWDDNNLALPDSDSFAEDTIGVEGFKVLGSSEGNISGAKERKGLLGYFYKRDDAFYAHDSEDFHFKVNPIIHFGYDVNIDEGDHAFINTRGLEIEATIDSKLYLYSSVLENQASFYNYINRQIRDRQAIPGNGFFKNYKSSVIDDLDGYDFLNAEGYLGYKLSKSVAIELGHGRHFIGDGMQSLFLADYSHNYFYLKLNTKIWKFNYQNIFAELAPISSKQDEGGDVLLDKKYMATHYLTYNPTKNLEFGLFESIIFGRKNHFEFQYLNPVILYRTIEQNTGSSDNALLGLSARWNVFNRLQIYSQVIFDEFKLDEILGGEDWWANKYGVQIGAKIPSLLDINNLDIQVEYNRVRPFTYGHRGKVTEKINQSVGSYSHYNYPLAHSLGANFEEITAKLNYAPMHNLMMQLVLYRAKFGRDTENYNYGHNILRPTEDRIGDYGNEQGQGIKSDIFGLDILASYQMFHNLFLDVQAIFRKEESQLEEYNMDSYYFGTGIRLNITPRRRYY